MWCNAMTQIVMSTSAEALTALLPTFTVEAEYGSSVVHGSRGTLAHHEAAISAGLDSGCPCLLSPGDELWGAADLAGIPRNRPDQSCVLPDSTAVIGVSHWDWDTAGGVFGLLGVKPCHGLWPKVWQSVAFTDERGPHRAEEFIEYTEVRPVVDAMRAYASANRITTPRETTAVDITERAVGYSNFLTELDQELERAASFGFALKTQGAYLDSGLPLLEAGLRYHIAQQDLEADSYVASFGGGRILLRASDRFVNHLYRHENRVAPIVIGFNTVQGSITLSFENLDAQSGLSASELMRLYFGDRAGGHRGIAGSPRNGSYSLPDAKNLARFVEGLL